LFANPFPGLDDSNRSAGALGWALNDFGLRKLRDDPAHDPLGTESRLHPERAVIINPQARPLDAALRIVDHNLPAGQQTL
jgi:hypothetical protein